ncbi:DoxX family membrane protein [Streptomyces yaizuensis]|uniref:DoxX family membrane protein n=1 Tax=Streptomyces yaizuensis TaxID=2989713 RepID=A0ABQ5NQW3_9ACTN|nr:DoxX family membrane protein [Streptomyces sp. YSPA8]GLF92710.1 DoxX family membrane protein [Streptomyces sp. YSPA8]
MDVLVLIGRILFVLLFLNSAVGHLTKARAMSGYAASKGVPAPAAAVVLSGLLLLAGSVSVLLGIWADLGALLLALFLFPTALLMHRFWQEEDPMAKQGDMIHFFKDVSLGGAALMLIAFFSYAGHDLGLTLTGPLFRIG